MRNASSRRRYRKNPFAGIHRRGSERIHAPHAPCSEMQRDIPIHAERGLITVTGEGKQQAHCVWMFKIASDLRLH